MEKDFRIVLATDYSESVMNAERYAVQLCRDMGFKLTMLHVEEDSRAKTGIEKLRGLERLEDRRERIFHTLGIGPGKVNCECVLRQGNITAEVLNEAKETDADFVFVGTHGSRGLRDLFFGSHTWDVIKRADVPVLAIPEEALYTGIKNIVFATEYREGEIPVINLLVQMARSFGASIIVLHVTNFVLSKQFEKEMFEKFRNEIMEKINYPKLEVRLIKSDDLVNGLDHYCLEKEVDWLVMSPEKPQLLGRLFNRGISATRRMMVHSHLPLLTIPDFYNPENDSFWKEFSDFELREEF